MADMNLCKYGDPTCPCQDGDLCHYEGENPMNVRPEYVRTAITEAAEAALISPLPAGKCACQFVKSGDEVVLDYACEAHEKWRDGAVALQSALDRIEARAEKPGGGNG